MGSYDGAESCELVGISILSPLSNIIENNDCGLYKDDGLLVLHNVSGQQIDRFRKNVIQLFKDIGFLTDIEINLKIVNFLDLTFSNNNLNYQPLITSNRKQKRHWKIICFCNCWTISHLLTAFIKHLIAIL